MRFIKKFFSYSIANAISKFISFFILPIYTRWISPNDYGQADLAYTLAGLLVSFVFMEIWVGLLRFMSDQTSDNEIVPKTYTTVSFISLFLILPYCAIQTVAGFYIGTQYTFFACLYGISHLLKNNQQYLLRGRKKTNIFIISGIIIAIGQLLSAYVLVVFLNFGAYSILLAPTFGNILAIIYMEYEAHNIRLLRVKYFNKLLAINILKFAAPLSINSLAFWAMNNINKFFAAYYLGYQASSYVSIAAKLTLVLSLVTSVFTLAWQEETFSIPDFSTKEKKYRLMSKAYLYLFTFGTIIMMLGICIIYPYYVGVNYLDAFQIIPLYFVAVYFAGMSAFLGTIFGAEKLTKKIMVTTLAGTLSNIILISLTINKWGVIVIPICAILSNFICMSMRYITLQRLFHLCITIRDLLSAFGYVFVCVALAYFIRETFLLAVASIVVIILLFITCYFELVKKQDIVQSILKIF